MDFNKLLAARQAAAKARGVPQPATLPPKPKVSAPPPMAGQRQTNPVMNPQNIVTAPPVAPGMKKGGKVKKMASGGKVRGAGIAKRGIGKCKAC